MVVRGSGDMKNGKVLFRGYKHAVIQVEYFLDTVDFKDSNYN